MFLQPPPNTHLYHSTNSILWFDKNGIFYSAPNDKPYRKLSKEESLKEVEMFQAIAAGKKLFMLSEPHPGLQPVEKEDREFISDQLNKLMGAIAIVSDSKFHVILIKIFFLFKPAPYPMNIFNSVEMAKEWLLEQMNKGTDGRKILMVA